MYASASAIANDVSFYLPLAEQVAAPWFEMHTRLQTIVRNKGASDAEELRLLCALEKEEVWLKVGEPGMVAYVERVLGYEPKVAQERMRVARALAELPSIAAELAKGELTYSAVKELTRVAKWETEASWLEKALGRTTAEVQSMVSGRRAGDLPESPPKPENIRYFIHEELAATTFAKGREARKVLEEELGHAIDSDTFYSMLYDRVLSGHVSDRARHQIAVTVSGCDERAWQHGGGRAIEIPPSARELAECDAERIGSLDAKTPTRASQDISPATRRLVHQRDGFRCQVPGCRASRNLDVHHIKPRSKGGTGDADNLVTLCAEHHRAHHDGKLAIERARTGELHIARLEPEPTPARAAPPDVVARVIDALVGMGFRKYEARSLVDQAIPHVGDPDPSALLREALRRSPTR